MLTDGSHEGSMDGREGGEALDGAATIELLQSADKTKEALKSILEELVLADNLQDMTRVNAAHTRVCEMHKELEEMEERIIEVLGYMRGCLGDRIKRVVADGSVYGISREVATLEAQSGSIFRKLESAKSEYSSRAFAQAEAAKAFLDATIFRETNELLALAVPSLSKFSASGQRVAQRFAGIRNHGSTGAAAAAAAALAGEDHWTNMKLQSAYSINAMIEVLPAMWSEVLTTLDRENGRQIFKIEVEAFLSNYADVQTLRQRIRLYRALLSRLEGNNNPTITMEDARLLTSQDLAYISSLGTQSLDIDAKDLQWKQNLALALLHFLVSQELRNMDEVQPNPHGSLFSLMEIKSLHDRADLSTNFIEPFAKFIILSLQEKVNVICTSALTSNAFDYTSDGFDGGKHIAHHRCDESRSNHCLLAIEQLIDSYISTLKKHEDLLFASVGQKHSVDEVWRALRHTAEPPAAADEDSSDDKNEDVIVRKNLIIDLLNCLDSAASQLVVVFLDNKLTPCLARVKHCMQVVRKSDYYLKPGGISVAATAAAAANVPAEDDAHARIEKASRDLESALTSFGSTLQESAIIARRSYQVWTYTNRKIQQGLGDNTRAKFSPPAKWEAAIERLLNQLVDADTLYMEAALQVAAVSGDELLLDESPNALTPTVLTALRAELSSAASNQFTAKVLKPFSGAIASTTIGPQPNGPPANTKHFLPSSRCQFNRMVVGGPSCMTSMPDEVFFVFDKVAVRVIEIGDALTVCATFNNISSCLCQEFTSLLLSRIRSSQECLQLILKKQLLQEESGIPGLDRISITLEDLVGAIPQDEIYKINSGASLSHALNNLNCSLLFCRRFLRRISALTSEKFSRQQSSSEKNCHVDSNDPTTTTKMDALQCERLLHSSLDQLKTSVIPHFEKLHLECCHSTSRLFTPYYIKSLVKFAYADWNLNHQKLNSIKISGESPSAWLLADLKRVVEFIQSYWNHDSAQLIIFELGSLIVSFFVNLLVGDHTCETVQQQILSGASSHAKLLGNWSSGLPDFSDIKEVFAGVTRNSDVILKSTLSNLSMSLVGALYFDKELRCIVNFFIENLERGIRNLVARLFESMDILTISSPSELSALLDASNDVLEGHLTSKEIMQLLQLRNDLKEEEKLEEVLEGLVSRGLIK